MENTKCYKVEFVDGQKPIYINAASIRRARRGAKLLANSAGLAVKSIERVFVLPEIALVIDE